MGTTYVLPGAGMQLSTDIDDLPKQAEPLLRYYSPRLLGAPPQLTNQCDMRILSSDGEHPGPVGDFYLTQILQDADTANFVVGRARFIGGMSTWFNILREMVYYGKALAKYNIYDTNGTNPSGAESTSNIVMKEIDKETYQKAYGERDTEASNLVNASTLRDILGNFIDGIDADSSLLNIQDIIQDESVFDNVASKVLNGNAAGIGALIGALKTSLSVQQPFYTFEEDWNTYINNVKMMINTAVIMLGLQKSRVRIGDTYYPIGMDVNVKAENDVWANYRFMTPTADLGDVNAIAKIDGDSQQYISFMVEGESMSESYSNGVTPSQLFSSVISSGSSVGNEIAFLTNSTTKSVTDSTINIAKESKMAAEELLKSMSSGNGRFTAAIASSMAKSFVGDHTIYPRIFQESSATTSMSFTIHLASDAGDPYSYLINILVPIFYMLGMTLPQLSNNNASAYTFPPIIQCNIPGMWGTRLGMITGLTIDKSAGDKDESINGFPLAVDMSVTITDLQQILVSSPMNRVSTFLNNQTMFDYIGTISGVDKYRHNGSMRTVARLALAASAVTNSFNNISDALMCDWHSLVNRVYSYNLQ